MLVGSDLIPPSSKEKTPGCDGQAAELGVDAEFEPGLALRIRHSELHVS